MNTSDQNGKYLQQAPKGFKIVYGANGKKLVKVEQPKESLLSKLLKYLKA